MSFSRAWKDVVDTPFKGRGITENAKEISKRMALRMRGNVRVSMGRIYTTADMDGRRAAAKLP